jgi:membrane-bound serine protease (ClpP class)
VRAAVSTPGEVGLGHRPWRASRDTSRWVALRRTVLAGLVVGGATLGGAIPALADATRAPGTVHAARVVHSLSANPNLAFLLFVVGLGGLIFELVHPGLHLPGALGLVAFVISLILLGRLPVNTGGVILLVVAFVFFVIELKAGGHAVAALAGVASLVLGGLFLYNPSVPSARVSLPLLIALAVLLGAFFVLVARAALKARIAPVVTGTDTLIGEEAVVTQPLDPSGYVRVRGEVWAATLDNGAGPAPVGAKLMVWDVQGLTLHVAPVERLRGESESDSPTGGKANG